MLSHLPLICWLLAGVVAEVQSSDGTIIKGNLESFDSQVVNVDTDGGARSLDVDQLQRIVFPDAKSSPPSTTILRLRNGSILPSKTISADDDMMTIDPRRIETIRLPITQASSLRFAPSRPTVDASWLGYLSENSSSDRMVIRRDNDVLDVIEGIIVGVDDETVIFEIDGDRVNAPRQRLEGIIWAGQNQPGEEPFVVVNVYGARLRCDQVELEQEKLRCRCAGQTIELSVDTILSIARRGNVIELATLSPVQQDVSLPMLDKVDASIVNRLFGLNASENPSGRGGVSTTGGGKTLTINGNTRLEYRIPDGMSHFEGVVQRNPTVVANTNIKMEILLDGEKVWEDRFESSDRRGFEIDVADHRRMVIRIDAMEDGPLGDRLELRDARFRK